MVSLRHGSLLESKSSLCLIAVALHHDRPGAILVVDDCHLFSVVLVVVVDICFVDFVAAVVVGIAAAAAAAVAAFDSRFVDHTNCRIAVLLVGEQDSLQTRLDFVELRLLPSLPLCDADLQILRFVDQPFDGA